MGATGWTYTTPYDPDRELALQKLREQIFETCDYLKPGEILRIPKDRGLLPPMPVGFWLLLFAARAVSAVSVAARWLARGGRGPRTIEEVLQDAAENGTHSILDIDHTADIPEFGCATPLSKQRLLKCFGTTTPTSQQVAEARTLRHEVTEDVRRWEAVYLTVHDESGEPLEYMFIGASGD